MLQLRCCSKYGGAWRLARGAWSQRMDAVPQRPPPSPSLCAPREPLLPCPLPEPGTQHAVPPTPHSSSLHGPRLEPLQPPPPAPSTNSSGPLV